MMTKWLAGLLAGTAPTLAPAQEAAPSPPLDQATPPTPAPRPPIEFRTPDGKPLPPEVQRQLEERFRTNPPPAAPADGGDVVVSGQRPRGSVIGDIPPERTLNALDIRAFGANSIEELLGALGPQVTSTRGRGTNDSGAAPVVLLNGKRVSSFAEIASIPTEAIQRTEVFPEELALKYGYRADQKVVNVVLFERYAARVGQLIGSAATQGGRGTGGGTANLLRIRGDTRATLEAEYQGSGALTEGERGLVQAGAPELGRVRTLLPASDRAVLGGTISGSVLPGIASTLNARFEATGSEGLLGRGADRVLTRDVDTRNVHGGVALTGVVADWQWSFTGNYDRVTTDTLTDVAGRGRDRARFVNAVAGAELVASGSVLTLPAGPVTASVRAGAETRDFSSRSTVAGATQRVALSRDRGAVRADLDLPISTRSGASPSPIGNLSANLNAEVEEVSGFGTLRTVGYGLRWSPLAAISLIASATDEGRAPSAEQLGGPLLATPNVRFFDFARGEAVDITRLSGGTPGLRADDRHVVRVGLSARPFARTDLNLTIDYTATRIDDAVATFPVATPAIEAAFPERFTRGPTGRLLQVDARPLNFARAEQEQLRWGFNFTRTLGALPAYMRNAAVRVTAPMSEAELQRRYPGAVIMRAPAGGGMADTLTSRLFVSAYHLWRFQDELLVRPGGPVLDLLDGAGVGLRGGRARHEVEVQAGVYRKGLGARVTASWQSGTTLRGVGGDDLRFGGLATVNLNLFANLADRFGGRAAPAWLKGTRASLGVGNLFNDRADVRDRSGATPLSYQPAYLDPLGRTVTFSLRKLF